MKKAEQQTPMELDVPVLLDGHATHRHPCVLMVRTVSNNGSGTLALPNREHVKGF